MNNYQSIAEVSLTALIPLIYGVIFYFVYSKDFEKTDGLFGISFKGHQLKINRLRMIYIFVLSFLSVLLFINITDPVPDEGWLRTLSAAILFSGGSVLVYSILVLSSSRAGCWSLIAVTSVLFLLSVIGLSLHHPWNYLMFISPFYWAAWSWIVPSPAESAIYAVITLVLSGLFLLILSVISFRKQGRY